MNCIYCGTPLSEIDYCTGCGADITILKRVIRISNLLYNEGLDKANVRDLSGAIKSLKRSLEYNKENKDARNLLGLVYFESGEAVLALTEWVISKNLNPDDNVAGLYIDKLRADKNWLDSINQTIRKYNQALVYCREDNDDMAIIQLKRVISQNPKLIKAYHLLALLYLKRQEYEKARKLLKKAAFIDTNNTTTLRYLQEVEFATGISTSLDRKRKKKYAKEKTERANGTVTYTNGNDMIIQPATFRDSSSLATFFNIFLGIVLGAAVVGFLVVPSSRQSIYDTANAQVTDANAQVATQAARVRDLTSEIESYDEQIALANQERDEASRKAQSYEQILEAANYYIAGDISRAVSALNEIDEESLEDDAASLYADLQTALSQYVYDEAYAAGTTAYTQGDYKTAISQLTKAVEAKPDEFQAWYYLAFSYRNSGNTAKANEVFRQIARSFPSEAASYNIVSYITEEETDADEEEAATGVHLGEPEEEADETTEEDGDDSTLQDEEDDSGTDIGEEGAQGADITDMLGLN